MKSLLDNNGVKKLVQNIKYWVDDNVRNIKYWAESKFIDNDNKIYYPWEICYLSDHGKLKPRKQYKIDYQYESSISYNYNISLSLKSSPSHIYLTAIDGRNFINDAIFSIYKNGTYQYFTIKFDYGYNKYTKYYAGRNIPYIKYNNFNYYLSYIYNFGSDDSIINFTNTFDNTNIYAKNNNLKSVKSNDTITFFLDKDCTIEAQGTYYYNGLGTITYLKDNNGNEAPFDFINLKINDKNIITGSNNIIKSFNPGNPIFISGDNNTVEKECNNVNINGNYNFVDLNCKSINIETSNNIVNKNCKNISCCSSNIFIGENCDGIFINVYADNSIIGHDCYGIKIDGNCIIGNYNCFCKVIRGITRDYTKFLFNYKNLFIPPTFADIVTFYNNKIENILDLTNGDTISIGTDKNYNDYFSIKYFESDESYYLQLYLDYGLDTELVSLEDIIVDKIIINSPNGPEPISINDSYIDDEKICIELLFDEMDSAHDIFIESMRVDILLMPKFINTYDMFRIKCY